MNERIPDPEGREHVGRIIIFIFFLLRPEKFWILFHTFWQGCWMLGSDSVGRTPQHVGSECMTPRGMQSRFGPRRNTGPAEGDHSKRLYIREENHWYSGLE